MTRPLLACLGLFLAACGAPHVRAEAMTASEHERAASAHLTKAREAEDEYDPDDRPGLPCLLLGMHGGSACNGKRHNETAEWHEEAERERRRAAEHEASAAQLRADEERACRGLTAEEADGGPLLGGVAVFGAQPLIDYDDEATVFGVVLAFEAGGPDADRLQLWSQCHRARVASRGVAPDHECPLDDPAIDVLVAVTPRGTMMELRSDDPAAAKRAWERSKRAARASRERHPRASSPHHPRGGS